MKLKNLLYLFFIPVLAFSLVACDSDDDGDDTSIIGTWKFQRYDYTHIHTSSDFLSNAIGEHMVDSILKWNRYTIHNQRSEYTFNEDLTFTQLDFDITDDLLIDTSTYVGYYRYEDGIVYLNYDYNKRNQSVRIIEESDDKIVYSRSFELSAENGTGKFELNLDYLYSDNINRKLYKHVFEDLLLAYPDIMQPLANLTNEEIENLEVHDAKAYLTYKRQ